MDTIFKKSRKGRNGFKIDDAGTGLKDLKDMVPESLFRKEKLDLPEISENEVLRHYKNLALKNYGVDTGTYPLGSCTMKYNPKINEEISKMECFTDIHPLQREQDVQGCLEVLYNLGEMLKKIIGLDAITFQPAAGAHGELCGLLIAKEYFKQKGQRKHKVIIPDSAHGTNFASTDIAGFELIEIKSDRDSGTIDLVSLNTILEKNKDEIALIMITNPNTLGIFEKNILKISDLVHQNGGLVYYDGANLNAIIGKARPSDMGVDIVHINLHKTFSAPHGGGGPGSGPVLVKKELKDFLPVPLVEKRNSSFFLDYEIKYSIGKIKSFYGNFSVALKAYCYLLSFGDQLKTIAEDSVLNANYLKKGLENHYDIPYSKDSMHEFVISAKKYRDIGLNALNIAKRLIDYGIHPPTVYFPTIIEEALMLEPTETENLARLDHLIKVLKNILKEGKEQKVPLDRAPLESGIKRIDELRALKKPHLTEDF